MSIIHIDLYFVNKKHVLTIIGKFSSFSWEDTIPDINSINIISSIVKCMTFFGVPEKIVCDQGAELSSDLFKDFCRQYDMELQMTSFQQSSRNS